MAMLRHHDRLGGAGGERRSSEMKMGEGGGAAGGRNILWLKR